MSDVVVRCNNGCAACCAEKVEEIHAHAQAELQLEEMRAKNELAILKAKKENRQEFWMLGSSALGLVLWGGFSAYWYSLHQVLPPVPEFIQTVVTGGIVGVGVGKVASKIKGKKDGE